MANGATQVWDSSDWDAAMQSLLDESLLHNNLEGITEERESDLSMDLGYNEESSDEEDTEQRWQDRPITCYRGRTDGEAAEREWAFLNQTSMENMALAFRQRVLRGVAALDASASLSPVSTQPKVKLFSDELSDIDTDTANKDDTDSDSGSRSDTEQAHAEELEFQRQDGARHKLQGLDRVRRHLQLTTRTGSSGEQAGGPDVSFHWWACPAPGSSLSTEF
ncbi:hypothetical protein C8R43DRAFT_1120872 [Mycena crocata]|nr:hypothetical protein C8R43DRAFT_1120872 [Mycena crocata]